MSRILYLSSRPPHPEGKGDALTCHHYLRVLGDRGWDIDVISLRWWNDTLEAELPQYFSGSYDEIRVAKRDLLRPEAIRAIHSRKWPIQAAASIHAIGTALSRSNRRDADVFYCHYLRTALPALNAGLSGEQIVAGLQLTQGKNNRLLASRRSRLDPRGWAARAEATRCEVVERGLADEVSAVVFTSPGDVEYLGLEASPRVHVIPHGVVLSDELTREDNVDDGKRTRPVIAFSGSMNFGPNVEGITWFVREVFPKIKARHPDVLVRIVGRDPHARVRGLADDNIVVTGGVASVAEELRRSTMAIAPIRAAAGMQNKVLEAADAGCPIVATPEANLATGLPEDCIIEATTADEWFDAVSKLISDPQFAQELGRRARLYVMSSWSWEAQIEPLILLLKAASVARR